MALVTVLAIHDRCIVPCFIETYQVGYIFNVATLAFAGYVNAAAARSGEQGL